MLVRQPAAHLQLLSEIAWGAIETTGPTDTGFIGPRCGLNVTLTLRTTALDILFLAFLFNDFLNTYAFV